MKKVLMAALAAAAPALAQAKEAFQEPAANFPYPFLIVAGDKTDTGVIGPNYEVKEVNAYKLNDLNDRVTKVSVPPGYVLAAFEDADFKGQSALFFGTTDIVGALAGKVSSFKIRQYSTLDCAVGYEHAGLAGKAWPFCIIDGESIGADPESGWKEQISSVEVPAGMRLAFCPSDSSLKPCRSYSETTNYVGHASNDSFASGYALKFNKDKFSMIFMSDPQFGWGGTKPNERPRYSDTYATWEAAAASMALSMIGVRLPLVEGSFAGVVVNGDISNTGDGWQLDKFVRMFQKSYDNVYVGLGNHDFGNYIMWQENDSVLRFYDRNVSGAPGLVSYDIDGEISREGERSAYNGSLAYSWDIGDVHFVQLNYFPSLHVKAENLGGATFDVHSALDWLDSDLKAHGAGKRIVLNMHALYADAFDPQGCENPCALPVKGSDKDRSERQNSTNTPADWNRFATIIQNARDTLAKDNILVLFAGHTHHRAGSGKTYYIDQDPAPPNYYDVCPRAYFGAASDCNSPTPAKPIPILYTGSAQYSLHLVVDFDQAGVTVHTIDSRYGAPNEVDKVRIENSGHGLVSRP